MDHPKGRTGDLLYETGAFGHDQISGFSVAGGDKIVSDTLASFQDLLNHAVQSGDNTLVTIDANTSFNLLGVHKDTLTAANFMTT